jgi:transposase
MDMWEPFIRAVLEGIPDAGMKICFDRLHASGYFNKAVDWICSQEHKAFTAGTRSLNRTKYAWLRSRSNDGYKDKKAFLDITRVNLKTARAWRIKEPATGLWAYCYRAEAERNWKMLLALISRSRLEPMKMVGSMVKSHLWGILNVIMQKATIAIGESYNATILKTRASLWT